MHISFATSYRESKVCVLKSMRVFICLTVIGLVFSNACDTRTEPLPDFYTQWENSFSSDPTFFPIGVWLQNPSNASAYKDMGINLYVGLWNGPTVSKLSTLELHGMPVICEQNTVGLESSLNSFIKAWQQQDEPDNAQWNGSSYDPCIPPEELISIYGDIRSNDSTRPVFLNFGQGVAYTEFPGRGDCFGDVEYYFDAVDAADIVAFDIYPVTSKYDNIRGNLEYVSYGVKNLKNYLQGKNKMIWNFIETTHINSETERPTPEQIEAEVWMSLISGSMGIIYFVHEWEPSFREDGIFRYQDAVEAVRQINTQITALAPVLNSQAITDSVEVTSSIPIELMVKKYDGDLYIFSVAMRNSNTTAVFNVNEIESATIDVIGENRNIALNNGTFQDSFQGYEVHLYQVLLSGQVSAPSPPKNFRVKND